MEAPLIHSSSHSLHEDLKQAPRVIEIEKEDPLVFTFPDLVSREFLAIILSFIVLSIWSLTVDAPLKAIADPNWTENPAKAPWYFVGLQEVLVYFDPWIAGVGIPVLIIIGLMAIPYLDPNPKGVGMYNLRDRPFAVSMFMVGYILWFVLIIYGQYFRGPNWQFYWPWEDWAVHKEADQQLVSLSFNTGIAATAAYFIVGIGFPALIARSFYKKLGFVKHVITWTLVLLMFSVIIKMVLRIFFHIKYILITPWFSI